MTLARLLILSVIIAGLGMAALVWVYPNQEDFRDDNPNWNGTADALNRYGLVPLDSLADLPSEPGDGALILIPYTGFTADELARLDTFLAGGGTLILADDFGFGNQVMEHLGVAARFSSLPVLDRLVYERSPKFPRAVRVVASEPLTDNITTIVLNHTTALKNVGDDAVLIKTSPFSYLDENKNGKYDSGEETGPLPVMARLGIRGGYLILIADPSIIINSMSRFAGDSQLLRNLAASAPVTFFDQSHLPDSILRHSKDWLAQARQWLANPAGTVGTVVLALALALGPIWRKGDNHAS